MQYVDWFFATCGFVARLGFGARVVLLGLLLASSSTQAASQAALIASGGSHTLQIRGGKLYAWGSNSSGQLGDGSVIDQSTPTEVLLPSGVRPIAVAAGAVHSLAIGSNGKLYAWGNNNRGQLGDGSATNRNTPIEITLPNGATPTAIAAGESAYHSLAIGSDGKLYAWGSNNGGALGDGTVKQRYTPVAVNLPQGVQAVAMSGAYQSLAIGSDGKLYAWGSNARGQIGDGTTTDRATPVAISLPNGIAPAAVAASVHNSLVIDANGSVYVWGLNNAGQLGDGTLTQRITPTAVALPVGVRATAAAAGADYCLVAGSDGKLYAWGANSSGQLGDGTTTQRNTPTTVNLPLGASPNVVIAGASHSLAVDLSGELYAWGLNAAGQLGVSTLAYRTSPGSVRMPTGVNLAAIASSTGFNLATGSDGTLYAWGANTYGQLGDGTTIDHTTPVAVLLPSGVHPTSVAVGGYHAVAIGSDGQLYTWGANTNGQLGDGTTVARLAPTLVALPGGAAPILIAAGYDQSFATGSDGKLYAWGRNDAGQLGDGSSNSRDQTTPVAVSLPVGVTATAIAVGQVHSLVIGSNGLLYGWGSSGFGELGPDLRGNQLTPAAINSLPAGVSATAIAAGRNHSLAIGSDSKLYSWGDNCCGQLGDNTSRTTRATPAAINLSTGVNPVAIAAGSTYYSAAIGSDGVLYTWGCNSNCTDYKSGTYAGLLGDGGTTNRLTPVAITLPPGVAALALPTGSFPSRVIGSDHKLYAWSDNRYGQLGDGSTALATGRVLAQAVGPYPTPGNDDFSNREALSDAAGTVTGGNVDATREGNEPQHFSGSSGRTVWWSWTAQFSGTLTLDTDGSSFDTVLAVYTGSELNALTLLAANNDASGTSSRIVLPVQEGVEYQIAVDGFGTAPPASGAITLNWAFTIPTVTTTGTNVTVVPLEARSGSPIAALTFNQVTQAGVTTVSASNNPPSQPAFTTSCSPAVALDISTTATFDGTVTVCVDPEQAGSSCAANAALWHWSASSGWTKLPAPAQTPAGQICGITTSFSPFAVFAPTQQAQTITFPTVASQTLGTAPISLSASASSGLAVAFESLSTSVCAVSGNTVTLLATGTCTIAAHQAGNELYTAAADVIQGFTVAANSSGESDGDSSSDAPLPAWSLLMLSGLLGGALRLRQVKQR